MKIFNLKTKTPLWTGGIDGQCDRLHETGFIGSLRWWYEAILRGLGHQACDPRTNSCSDEAGFCKACEIFGATSRRRQFCLRLDGGKLVFTPSKYSKYIHIKPPGRSRGWYYGSGWVGNITLKLISLSNSFIYLNHLKTALLLASKWGGLGARTQHGYGVMDITNELTPNLSDLPNTQDTELSNLPNLRHFFFSKVRFSVSDESSQDWWEEIDGFQDLKNSELKNLRKWVKSGSVPIAPAIKNWLRYGEITGDSVLDSINSASASNELFGYTKPNNKRKAANINISCAYPISKDLWELRIWGWVPKSNRYDREKVLDSLKKEMRIITKWKCVLSDKITKVSFCWYEFDSCRDTQKKKSDFKKYLQSLLF